MSQRSVGSTLEWDAPETAQLEDHRDAVAAAVAEHPELATLISRYFRHVAAEDLPSKSTDVIGIVRAHRRLAEVRDAGVPRIRLFNPQVNGDDWSAESTVIDLVNDDMPFLVDSVSSALTAAGVVVHRVLHPILDVRRDADGRLLDVLGAGGKVLAHRVKGTVHESWMHLLIDRITDAERAESIEAALDLTLRQVRDVVDDEAELAATARETATLIRRNPPPRPASEIIETADLLDWFADGHLTFLGAQQYEVAGGTEDQARRLLPVAATGLGLLRDNTDPDGFTAAILGPEPHDAPLLITTRASAPSPLAKNLPPFCVAVRLYDEDGAPVGEQRFLGILTPRALNAELSATPVLRRLLDDVLLAVGATADSYNGQRALDLLSGYPRAELFSAPTDSVISLVRSVLQSIARRQLRLFLQPDPFGRFISALVFLPRDRYTTTARLAMQDVLVDELEGTGIRYTARVGDAALASVHFVISTNPTHRPDIDLRRITDAVRQTIRTWEDELVAGVLGGDEDVLDTAGERTRYREAFDEAYKESYSSATAVRDLHILDELAGPSDLALSMSAADQFGCNCRLKVYVAGSSVTLSRALPLLQSLGAVVVDENPYQVTRSDGTASRIYDFGLQFPVRYLSGDEPAELQRRQGRLTDAFRACWTGAAEVDGFNELVLAAGLDWREVAVLRGYAKYLRQIGSPYTQGYLESVLVGNAALTAKIAELFAVRFDPERYVASTGDAATGASIDAAVDAAVDTGTDAGTEPVVDRWADLGAGDARADRAGELAAEINSDLDQVASLDADRILRSYLGLVIATRRSNAYRRDGNGERRPFWSFKLDPRRVPRLPKPVPAHEIWVYSPHLEGVHLRFGDIARGGLRWSDRPEDFRTEILGLVKAQEVKNAVIVPVGAKGGFVVKRPPQPTGDPVADREAQLAEGVRCYRMFIQGLLDLTDNRVGDRVVGPPDVVRHDDDDSYLVVAADKGTATFSDIANSVALENGFWLGDAFASGGSAGYDHKAMGITARGAWESVKHHFRELGLNTQTEDFTVVGVGDMSGDVFGNGMLLSSHIRLLAAFDHRHVFIDPDPDPATSFEERRRLFRLPRSSWADYDPALISAGGGVFPRTAKQVDVTPQMRAALGLADDVRQLSPAELIHAVLLAPADLLFNGGVGTYVKAAAETHLQVGDKANDAVRVDGNQLRVKVVGEGGNLGVTQLGRIEFARAGGRINTDAIDNSAGVDTSDHEVNIKIALQPLQADGQLSGEQRSELLAAMTDEVAALVLADNTAQNRLLGVSRLHAVPMASVHARLIDDLVDTGRLDRRLEALPTDAELASRRAAGEGLTSPELAVLVAYVKSGLANEMLRSELPDLPIYASRLPQYFPEQMRVEWPQAIESHPLARHIVTTMTVNEVVNGAGITYPFRLAEEMAAGPSDIIRAYTVTTQVYGLQSLWDAIASRDHTVAAEIQDELNLLVRRLLDRAARWFLMRRPQPLDVATEIDRYRRVVAELSPQMPRLVVGTEHAEVREDAAALLAKGAPADLANRVLYALYTFSLLDVADVATEKGRAPLEVAELYYALSDHLGLGSILSSVSALDRGDRWHALARQAVRDGLYASMRAITADVLTTTDASQPADDKIAQWEGENRFRLERARTTLGQIARSGAGDLAALSVAAREISSMVR